MYFCIRDDDTNFFTTPEDLESAYGEIHGGTVSLAIVPFARAGTSKAVPEQFRKRWTVHPLHENLALVSYLRAEVAKGRFEPMLHGYHHDERDDRPEFRCGRDLRRRAADGRKYLEDLIGAPVRVFVPPHNSIGGEGLRAIVQEGLNLAGAAGVRGGWSLRSPRTWRLWLRLRRWRRNGGLGVPWILDLGDHREIAGNAVTPYSRLARNLAAFDSARALGGAFCAATHYWEHGAPSVHTGDPTVGEQLRRLIDQTRGVSEVQWKSVGDTLAECPVVL